MKSFFLLLFFSGLQFISRSQELFVFSEPASNMAAKSIGLRLNNFLMQPDAEGSSKIMIAPEVMLGISKKIMVHAEGFFSNKTSAMAFDGASVYAKYRFLSQDEVHNHFRMAAYARAALSNMHIHQHAIDFNGQNSGYEAGLVATKLIHKVALSAGGSFMHATNNSGGKTFLYDNPMRNALGYNISVGKLMLPKSYENYEQLNVNLMGELLGQYNLGSKQYFIDFAPSVQFIILSRMRVDAAYRFPLTNKIYRPYPSMFLLRFEYNIFNAYK